MKTHNKTNTPLHKTWMRMNKRCNNPNYESFHRYGGRGIKVCDRWKKFENFYNDMFSTYKPGLTLERIDNDKGYGPDNCVWATKKHQANNRHTNVFITYNGETKTVMEFSELSGINRTTIQARLKSGWNVKDAIFNKPWQRYQREISCTGSVINGSGKGDKVLFTA